MSGYIYNYIIHKLYKKNFAKNTLERSSICIFERTNLGPIRNDTSCIWDLASHEIFLHLFIY